MAETVTPVLIVRNPKMGKLVTVRGAGALKDNPLKIRKGIDLTKPIAVQVLKVDRKQKLTTG